ncbi:unnamed protein product, partial [Mesorhabditis spiculigera]
MDQIEAKSAEGLPAEFLFTVAAYEGLIARTIRLRTCAQEFCQVVQKEVGGSATLTIGTFNRVNHLQHPVAVLSPKLSGGGLNLRSSQSPLNRWSMQHDLDPYLHSGQQFDLLRPTAGMIKPLDIAHALSNLCRFNGHTRTHYSVAQHS